MTFNEVIVIVIDTLQSAISWEPLQMRQAWACIWAYTVLPATRTLNPIGKDSSPITTQSSAAVTHCILAAPQFTYPEGMAGWVDLSPGDRTRALLRGERSKRPLNRLS
jgi:hypothetical protein